MIQFYCAHLNIFIRSKEEERDRLSKLYNFLEITLNKEEKFSPYTLQSIGWLDEFKWDEVCKMPKDDSVVNTTKANIPMNIGDEVNGIALEINKFDNYKLMINIHRREMMFEENTCLQWHQDLLLLLLIESSIVDIGFISSKLSKVKKEWYFFKNKSDFYIGKKNFLILDEFHGYGTFSNKRKKILTDFIQKNWNELNREDKILTVLKKEKKDF